MRLLHPRDIWLYLTNHMDATVIIGGCITGASLLLLSGSVEQRAVRRWYFAGAMVVALSGQRGRKIQQRFQPMMAVAQDESLMSYQEWLKSEFALAPAVVDAELVEETGEPKQADLQDVGKAHHIMIVGPTGTGKTTLAVAISNQNQRKQIIFDPHGSPDDWKNLEVIGAGRDYAAINAAMEGQLDELDRRFQRRAQGKPVGKPLTILVDEWPAIAQNCPKAEEWIATMTFEARKVGLQLCILTQSDQVEALGIKGKGQVRKQFSIIRLGSIALDYAKTLKSNHVLLWLKEQQRPGMIDDLPIAIPDLSIKSLPASPVTAIQDNQPTLLQSSESKQDTKSEPQTSNESAEENLPPAAVLDDEQLLELIQDLKAEGRSMTSIIGELWGLKRNKHNKYAGRAWTRARQEYRELVGE